MMMDENQCVTKPSDSNTVCSGMVNQDSVYIDVSTYQTGKNVGGGEEGNRRSTQYIEWSQLALHSIEQGYQCTLIFKQLICDWGRQIKLKFLSLSIR
jgi:hypothetical protein